MKLVKITLTVSSRILTADSLLLIVDPYKTGTRRIIASELAFVDASSPLYFVNPVVLLMTNTINVERISCIRDVIWGRRPIKNIISRNVNENGSSFLAFLREESRHVRIQLEISHLEINLGCSIRILGCHVGPFLSSTMNNGCWAVLFKQFIYLISTGEINLGDERESRTRISLSVALVNANPSVGCDFSNSFRTALPKSPEAPVTITVIFPLAVTLFLL